VRERLNDRDRIGVPPNGVLPHKQDVSLAPAPCFLRSGAHLTPRLTYPSRFSTLFPMSKIRRRRKSAYSGGSSGRVPVPPEKRFLIN